MKTEILRPLLISAAVSLIAVLGGYILNEYLFREGYLCFAGAVICWLPGYLVLSAFVGGWAVIHVDPWITLAPVVSFLFWVVVCLIVRKVFLILRKRKDN